MISEVQSRERVRAFNELFQAIKAHNYQYSGTRTTAAGLVGIFEALIDDGDHVEEVNPAEEAAPPSETREPQWYDEAVSIEDTEEDRMQRSITLAIEEWILTEAGLQLKHHSPEEEINGQKVQTTSGKANIQIVDGGKFGEFLQSIHTSTVDETFQAQVASMVWSIVSRTMEVTRELAKLQGQTDQEYLDGQRKEAGLWVLIESERDHLLELVTYAPGIASGLKNIGIEDDRLAADLLAISVNAKDGVLPEFVEGHYLGVYDPVQRQGSRLSSRHRDTSAEPLAETWNGVTTYVTNLKLNPSTERLYAQVGKRVAQHFEFAEADWKLMKDELAAGVHGYRPTYGEGFDDVFATTRMSLTEIGVLPDHRLGTIE